MKSGINSSTTAPIIFAVIFLIGAITASGQNNWVKKSFEQKVFIENKGQFNGKDNLPNSKILFGVDDGMQIYFTKKGLTYRMDKAVDMTREEEEKFEKENSAYAEHERKEGKNEKTRKKLISSFVAMEWLNANPATELIAEEKTTEYWNYFNPANPGASIDNCYGYKKLIYKNLYPNIDVVYEFPPSPAGEGRGEAGIKYSLVLHPGADVSKVQMKYIGSEKLFKDEEGNINIITASGNITDHAPKTFYEDGENINSAFDLTGNIVSFSLPSPLSFGEGQGVRQIIIDPWVVTNLTAAYTPTEIGRDAANNVYVYGLRGQMNWATPISTYAQKYDPSGTLLWTFIVSSQPQFDIDIGDLAVEPSGNAYLSSGLDVGPLVTAIIKLSPTGSLIWNNLNSPYLYENWRLSFNCDYTQLVNSGCASQCCNLAGGTVVNTASGAESNYFNPANEGDIQSACFAPNGYFYALAAYPGSGPLLATILCLNPATGFSVVSNTPATYYQGDADFSVYGSCGFNGIAADCNFLWINRITLEKRNLITGSLLGSITLPNAWWNTNSGIAIDKCGNVYAGSTNGIYVYDSNLNLLTTFSTPFTVTDIVMGTGSTFYACGGDTTQQAGFVAQFSLQTTCPSATPVTITPASCTSGGSATANPVFCSPPYTYWWSTTPVQTTQTATGLGAGTYTLIVNGSTSGPCAVNSTDTVIVTITVSGLTLSVTSSNPSCGNNNGTVTAAPTSGTAPYTYSWSTIPIQTTQTATGLGAGTYTITVTDAVGCTTTTTVTLSPSAGLPVNATSTSAGCTATSTTGSATATPTGGNPPYTYLWNNGQTAQTATGLTAGNYTVTVTDAIGCTATTTVTVGGGTSPSVSASPVPATCNLSNGSATANPSGGTSPYTFLWNNGQTVQTAINLAAGNYTVTVTDANGCTAIATVNVGVSANGPSISVSSTPSNCTLANGAAVATSTGGFPPYSYLWSNGQTTSAATGLSAGTYTVIVTDSYGCTAAAIVSVASTGGITATASTTSNVSCNGGSNAVASVSAFGGSPPYTYQWNNGQTTTIATGLSAGTYTITVTDASGCSIFQTVNITQPAPIISTITSSPDNCNNNIGTATVIVTSGGTPPYTYLWNNGQTVQTATGLSAGNYTITISDANGCTQTQTITVTSSSTFTVNTSSTQTGCAVNNGTATANPSGGTSPYTYLWNNGQSSQIATGLGAGNYSVTVTDSNGCSQTNTIIVTNTGSVIATALSNVTITQGQSATLTASGGGTYLWSNGSANNPIIVSPPVTTIYCVTVTDANNCSDTACVTVTVKTEPIDCNYADEQLFIPDFFSPNGDAKNDVLLVYYPDINCIKDFMFIIYDRWGEKVFEATNISTEWDGTYKSKLMNTAVFVYYMKVSFITGNEVIRKGNISLIR